MKGFALINVGMPAQSFITVKIRVHPYDRCHPCSHNQNLDNL